MAKKQQVKKKSKSKPLPKGRSVKPLPKVRKLKKGVASPKKAAAKPETFTLSQLEGLLSRAFGSSPAVSPPPTKRIQLPESSATFTPADLMRGESQLFMPLSETGSVADLPDTTGIWGGNGSDVEIDDSRSQREDLLAFRGRTELHFEVLKNKFKELEAKVNEVYSHFRAATQGRGF